MRFLFAPADFQYLPWWTISRKEPIAALLLSSLFHPRSHASPPFPLRPPDINVPNLAIVDAITPVDRGLLHQTVISEPQLPHSSDLPKWALVTSHSQPTSRPGSLVYPRIWKTAPVGGCRRYQICLCWSRQIPLATYLSSRIRLV